MKRELAPTDRTASEPVTVQFHKHWGKLHWRHDMIFLGEGEHGLWLGGPSGCVMQRGHEPERHQTYAFAQLVPHQGDWSALFNERDRHKRRTWRAYVDICHEVRWTDPNRVEMFDRDLDVVHTWDRDVQILDQDEFEAHQKLHNYPPALIDAVEATTQHVAALIRSGTEPFATVGTTWLEQVRVRPHPNS